MSKKARESGRVQRKLAEVQRRQRARQRRVRILIGLPAAIAVVAAATVVAVIFAHSQGGVDAGPMAAAEKTGADGLSGPLLAGLDTAVQGSSVNGVGCDTSEQTVYHIHAHLDVFVNGQQRTIPYGIGIPGGTASQGYVATGTCFYWLHTHDQTGVIHIESPTQKQYTLGDFFAIWGQPLSSGQVGPDQGKLTVYVNGTRYAGDPASITLTAHELIQIDVGTNVAPRSFTFPAGE